MQSKQEEGDPPEGTSPFANHSDSFGGGDNSPKFGEKKKEEEKKFTQG